MPAAVHKLPPDQLGQVLLRAPNPDIRILSLVQKSWPEAVRLESNPRVWGRLLLAAAQPGVLIGAIRNAKVSLMNPPLSLLHGTSCITLLQSLKAHCQCTLYMKKWSLSLYI
jgi:hypothetical protein